MKTRHLTGCILIVSATVIILMRFAHKPRDIPQLIPQESRSEIAQPIPAVLEKVEVETVKKLFATNDPLADAYQMASFVAQVRDTLPRERASTREQLNGLQSIFFVSDYVMAAKTNGSLVLSQSAIVAAFTNISADTSYLRNRLATYADFPGTLADHYQMVSENPEAKAQVKAIESALAATGVTVDKMSDLLMDCIRFAYLNSEINEMYGSNPSRIQEATPYQPELAASINASETVFQHRLIEKSGLDTGTVQNLMSRLKEVRISGLSPADMEIPAHIH